MYVVKDSKGNYEENLSAKTYNGAIEKFFWQERMADNHFNVDRIWKAHQEMGYKCVEVKDG